MQLQQLKNDITPILKNYSVSFAGVFGSAARNEDREDSDVDILVKFRKVPGYFRYIKLEKELAQAIGKKVDLATEGSIHKSIRKNVLTDLIPLYEE